MKPYRYSMFWLNEDLSFTGCGPETYEKFTIPLYKLKYDQSKQKIIVKEDKEIIDKINNIKYMNLCKPKSEGGKWYKPENLSDLAFLDNNTYTISFPKGEITYEFISQDDKILVIETIKETDDNSSTPIYGDLTIDPDNPCIGFIHFGDAKQPFNITCISNDERVIRLDNGYNLEKSTNDSSSKKDIDTVNELLDSMKEAVDEWEWLIW